MEHEHKSSMSGVPAGIAIGNGLTDPVPQVAQVSVVGGALGLVCDADVEVLEQQQQVVAQLVAEGEWEAAAHARDHLIR